MNLTYDVRVRQVRVLERAKGRTSYQVRWKVGDRTWPRTFTTAALADSFRSELLTAARRGEAFDLETGQPLSWLRTGAEMDWYAFACTYVDMKWRTAAATYRRSIAEALTTATSALFITDRGRPDDRTIRSALSRWAFNTQRRSEADRPPQVSEALHWIERNTTPVSALADPHLLRAVLDALARRLDGEVAAGTVVNRKRAVLSNALEHAVELKLLDRNPLVTLKWKAPRTSHVIDRGSVANPTQARTLLDAVGQMQRSGPRLKAFFAVMYFAALRPEEAVALKAQNLTLPQDGWGEIVLEASRPDAGREWTNTGRQRDERQLKHRARGEKRRVPTPPELTAILQEHLDRFGVGSEGRLFPGERGGELPSITYGRVWRRARCAALTPEEVASPLASRPYDLRHAAVSTWLNGGVPPTQVAEWAGHSVAVLLQVYAKCLVGQDALARQRVEAALSQE